MEKISLMMITWNRLDFTKKTMEFINNTVSEDANLIIVDNGSTDGTVEYLKGLQRNNLYLHFNDANRGIAIGRNQALKIANEIGTDWYCTIDNDVELYDGWLGEAIEILKACPRFGMIGINYEGDDYPIKTINGKDFQVKPEGNLGTACIVFRKEVPNALGYFCTEYGIYGGEDADYCMRTRVIGYQLGYLKKSAFSFGCWDDDNYKAYKSNKTRQIVPQFRENVNAYYSHKKPVRYEFKE